MELIVTDELGCKDTLRKDSLIDTKPLPEPGFYADTLTGCRPFDVSFTDTSSGENPIKTWVWNYGDGSPPDSTVNPDHTFSDRGEYDITLTVEDTFNCKQSLTRNQYIKPTYPYPAFDHPDPICDFETISPTNNSTGTGLSYVWDFGDGTNPDSTANPTHSYALDTDTTRTLPITLKATDVNGCDSTLVDSITISKPIAGFGVDSANANCPPFSVSFLDSSTSDVTAWEWDFGDNSTKSNLENPSHTYSDAGYYDVQLIVTNGAGCRDTLKKDSLIQIGGPSGSFTDSLIPNSCYKKFLFEASTKNTDSITWVFGDGAIGTGDTATHEYKVPGNYFPTLVLQDSAGCQVSIPADTAIEIPPNDFSADFTYDSVVCNGEPVNFNEQSTGTELSFAWDFGDGSPVDSSPNPTHVYPWVDSTQTWTVTFTATDSANCDTTITKDVTVSKPVTDFSADTTFAACPPLDVQFTDATAGNINDWQWDLGDSSTASSKNPIHSYDWPGQYDVSLVTTDIHGCKDTLVKDALILVEGPTGSFRYEEIPGTCFSEYRFMADTKASTVTWEFGDGATGSGDTTVYDYQNDPGTYQPVMIMEDSTGCRVELPADSLIDIPQNPLTAGFTIDTNNVFDAPVHFEDASSSSTPIVEWIWDFGDGNDLVDSTGSVEYKYDSVGTFQAKLIVTDENGCRDTVSRPIKIREGIRIPNVFTPNNDGTNDHFKIKNSGVRAYRLEIFNRWGEKIFSTNGPNVDWDGTTAGDRPAPEGTYYFTLRYKILDKGAVKQVQGSLTLLR